VRGGRRRCEAVEAAAARLDAAFGAIYIWINNAMVSVFSPIHEMTAVRLGHEQAAADGTARAADLST
jgi:NAD(P)-dependent dehydrogenase (short-subunit alcohol dehydrogenase family)